MIYTHVNAVAIECGCVCVFVFFFLRIFTSIYQRGEIHIFICTLTTNSLP